MQKIRSKFNGLTIKFHIISTNLVLLVSLEITHNLQNTHAIRITILESNTNPGESKESKNLFNKDFKINLSAMKFPADYTILEEKIPGKRIGGETKGYWGECF